MALAIMIILVWCTTNNETEIMGVEPSFSQEIQALQWTWDSIGSEEVVIFSWNQKYDYFGTWFFGSWIFSLENQQLTVVSELWEDSFGFEMSTGNQLTLIHLWCGAEITYAKRK